MQQIAKRALVTEKPLIFKVGIAFCDLHSLDQLHPLFVHIFGFSAPPEISSVRLIVHWSCCDSSQLL